MAVVPVPIPIPIPIDGGCGGDIPTWLAAVMLVPLGVLVFVLLGLLVDLWRDR